MFAFLVVIATPTSLLPAAEPPVVAVVIGASGTPEYEKNFHQWADRWREAATLAKAEHVEIGPFINRLSGNRRVIVTATNSGVEQNYSRFGDHLSTAIADPAADLDHDEQVSLLEAFLSASAGVARFYEQEARLATEHPLLDDNGDKLGTPPTFFRGIRAVQSARGGAEPDGQAAHRYNLVPGKNQPVLSASQLQRRDQLEAAIEELRAQKPTLAEARYYEHLETLMIQLARLYEEADQAGGV